MMKISLSFDVHPLVPGRKLILAGIPVEHDKGLLGHSDGDVVLHALTDAILSAAGLPDIGTLFPDTEEVFKDKDSSFFLLVAIHKIQERGYKLDQVDLTIIADEPKISPYYVKMKKNLSLLLKLPEDRISIKARSTEGLIFQKEKPGIMCFALVVITPL